MRREWIEIQTVHITNTKCMLSPSMRREWIEIRMCTSLHCHLRRLPPCGGSGLKFLNCNRIIQIYGSPSMRREWIEIPPPSGKTYTAEVSLHAEGVD